jgi:serine phosphatase RsbU (regulator of sigma subunit)
VVAQADTHVAGLAALARALGLAASRPTLAAALEDLAAAARALAGADVALLRTPAGNRLEAVAVAGAAALAAELGGTQLPADDVPAAPLADLADAPAAVRRAAARAGARSAFVVPIRVGEQSATLELYRAGPAFTEGEQVAAELAAGQAALLVRAFRSAERRAADGLVPPALELAGEALAAALGEAHAAGEIVRVAATVVGAPVAVLWEQTNEGLGLVASYGLDPDTDLELAQELAAHALEQAGPLGAVSAEGLPGGCGISTTLALGQPAVGLLQLLFSPDDRPDEEQLARLTTFAVRAAHALRANARAQSLALELERTRALLAVVGQATAELSLAHTLETAVERVSELLEVEAVAVYLRDPDDDKLSPAAARALAGPHTRVAERLLELSFGGRERALVESPDVADDSRLRDVRDAARESGIDAALAVPLHVRNAVTGLLAVYPLRGRGVTANEEALLAALAGQLAVAVQNAQLHERETRLKRESEERLVEARNSARRLSALYQVSWSLTEELSLEKTVDTLAQTIVDALDVDAALISMPDERRELLTPRALHVQDQHLADAVRVILWRAEPFGANAVQQLFRRRTPYWLPRGHEYLEPFLARGWTGVVVPIAKGAETIAALTLLSFRPAVPLTQETVDDALQIVGQAALAVDNARLYQQQQEFADMMQQSLLPREEPEVAGLELGQVYESSARVQVGGDVYDFLKLDDGRLAVVLGDVTGHGVEATADMAMAKFVFRSLAREHPSPGEFLAAANEVVVGEIAPGKFITMTYVAVDAAAGEVACASAGHPPPRLVLPDGTVASLDAPGIVLGIDGDQTYDEVRAALPVGATIVLYTDGVVEARRGGELYGTARLDALLARLRDRSPAALARAVTEDAKAFAGGEVSDDLAVVAIRRTA